MHRKKGAGKRRKTNAEEQNETGERSETENNEETKIAERNDKNNPKTGDNIAIWALLITVSVLGIVATIKILKNRK